MVIVKVLLSGVARLCVVKIVVGAAVGGRVLLLGFVRHAGTSVDSVTLRTKGARTRGI